MNKTVIGIISFAAGAAIGSVATWMLVKNKYEQIAQEEIENLFAQNGRYFCYEQPYHRLITHAGEPPATTTEYIHCLIRE